MSRIPRSVLACTIAVQLASICVANKNSSTAPSDKPRQSGCVLLVAPPLDPATRGYARVLARELFRQAFLISAREEFGAGTRDEVLRENGPATIGGKSFRVQLDTSGPGLTLIPRVFRIEAGTPTQIWSGEGIRVSLSTKHELPLDYRNLSARAEALSRDAFAGLLESEGLTRSQPQLSSRALPAEVEQQLAALNPVDQYAAIRQIHGLIHAQGCSPELLGALVRGYAQLSVLTQSHWSSSHKVFLARSILYAQRLKAVYPGNPSGSFHLSYALALGGMHGLALEECEEGKRLANGSVPPTWLEMVEATSKFDNQKLDALAKGNGSCSDWACLMRLLQCELSNMPTKECELAHDLLDRQPYCLRLLAMISREGPISERHYSTTYAFTSLDELTRKRVSRVPGLPRPVALVLAGMQPIDKKPDSGESRDWRVKRVELVQTLEQAGAPAIDSGEPSWATLGRLIEEEWFVASFQRAWFIKQMLGIDPSRAVAVFLPLLPDHPYRNFLALCGIPSGEEKRQLETLMGQMIVSEPDVQMRPMFKYIDEVESKIHRNTTEKTGKKDHKPDIYERQRDVADDITRDLLNNLNSSNEKRTLSNARLLLKVSPHHPLAATQIIRQDWKSAERQLVDWEKDFGEHAAFIDEMARHYRQFGPPELAEKYSKKLIELAPEVSAYRDLADLYWRQKQPDKYVSTLQEALKLPELGLDHARVRVRLAEFYMDKGDYDAALPYAKKAAESGANDCLLCLSRCYEAMGNMKQSEKLVRESSEHYRTSGYRWYFWCKRTGFGDVEAARALAEECLVPRNTDKADEAETYGVYLQLAGEPRDAMEAFRKDFQASRNPNSGLFCAVLAIKMDNRKLYEEMLRGIAERSGRDKEIAAQRGAVIELAKLIQSQPEGQLDSKQVDAIVAKAVQGEAVNVEYFAGRFYEVFANQSLGNEYLLRAARRTDFPTKYTHVLACDRCRQLGLKIETQPAELKK